MSSQGKARRRLPDMPTQQSSVVLDNRRDSFAIPVYKTKQSSYLFQNGADVQTVDNFRRRSSAASSAFDQMLSRKGPQHKQSLGGGKRRQRNTSWRDDHSDSSIDTDEISEFSVEKEPVFVEPVSTSRTRRGNPKTTSKSNDRRDSLNSDFGYNMVLMGHFDKRSKGGHHHGDGGHDDCIVCRNKQMMELLEAEKPPDYGLDYLDEKIRKHVREPTSRTEGLTDLAAIMDERPKQNKALKNLGLYDEEDFGGEYDQKAFENLDPTCFLSDGKRKIDFVLAFTEPIDIRGPDDPEPEPKPQKEIDEENRKADIRETFLVHLEDAGVEIEESELDDFDTKIIFYKLHLPFDILSSLAEELNFRVALEEQDSEEVDLLQGDDGPEQWSAQIIDEYLSFIPNFLQQRVPNEPRRYLTSIYREDCLKSFKGHEFPGSFFKIRHRIRIAHELLKTTVWGDEDKAEVGIEGLLLEGVFTAAYPVHDGPFKIKEEEEDIQIRDLNARQILFRYWAFWENWSKYQPIHHVREYYGEEIGFYFYFLGYYTAWLLPPAVFGLIAQICAVTYAFDNPVASDICGVPYVMCPLCDACDVWNSEAMCLFSTLGAAFDNQYTISFAIFVAIWSVLFLEYWKRSSAQLAAKWEVYDYAPLEERPRPSYVSQCREMKRNAVTGRMEPHFPSSVGTKRRRMAGAIITFLIGCIFGIVFTTVVVRSFMNTYFYEMNHPTINKFNLAPALANGVGAAVQGVGMAILTMVYTKLALVLTEWEMNRTETEFKSSHTLKMFIFQFFNNYIPILYIAFFKGKALGSPKKYTRIFGARMENCPNSDCLWEMAMQLIVFFVAKQWIQNFVELGVPIILGIVMRKLKAKQRADHEAKLKAMENAGNENPEGGGGGAGSHAIDNEHAPDGSSAGANDVDVEAGGVQHGEGEEAESEASEDSFRTRWESDYFLAPNPGLYEEYLELMIQFGFITIFACAFPVGPLLACLNNWMEIRVDAYKLNCVIRRPVPQRAKDIGFWYSTLATCSTVCVITNAYLICFTSYYLDRVIYRNIHPDDKNLDNFFDFVLTEFNYTNATSNQQSTCMFLNYGYYNEEGNRSPYFWRVLALKLIMAMIFVGAILMIGRVLDLVIDDVPEEIDLKMRREAYLARQAVAAAKQAKLEDDAPKEGAPKPPDG